MVVIKKQSYLVVAALGYGPYQSKTDAMVDRRNLAKNKAVAVDKVVNTPYGYAFEARICYEASNTADKAKAVAALKNIAPNAKIIISKI
ncbi:MAG: hypothetical protein M0R51_15665 [Clostridia bacterium]|jgi:hypothetical protein|nr:hypothetical protein [Clostridia bacterium]